MFERIAVDIKEYRDEYLKDPDYKKAMELYDKSIAFQKKGNPSGFHFGEFSHL